MQKFLVLLRTMNVYVANIKDSSIVVLSVKNVGSKSLFQELEENEWVILSYQHVSHIFGF